MEQYNTKQRRFTMPTPSVRIGLIGIGNIGSAHLRWMLAHPEGGLSVAALCDTDPQKRDLLHLSLIHI